MCVDVRRYGGGAAYNLFTNGSRSRALDIIYLLGLGTAQSVYTASKFLLGKGGGGKDWECGTVFAASALCASYDIVRLQPRLLRS